MYWKYSSSLLLKCIDEDESQRVMVEMHKGACGGHLYWKSIANKILRAGCYWPTMFSDVYEKVRACLECQKFVGKEKLHSLPLNPVSIEAPFQQWGLNFIGEIHPPSTSQHKQILTATDYFTKWIKVVPIRNETDTFIIMFLTENILSRFRFPRKLVTDNAQSFKYEKLVSFCQNHNITFSHSTPYYPQGNGLVESSNKSLVRIIKNLFSQNNKNWDSKLVYALWVDRVSSKKSIGTSPFQLVYGVEAVIQVQLALPVMKFFQEDVEEPNPAQRRMLKMIELNQVREALVEKTQVYKDKVKSIFDKRQIKRTFTLMIWC